MRGCQFDSRLEAPHTTDKMYTLKNWSIVCKGDPYMAPELLERRAQGDVYGHPEWEEGYNVVTSYIVDQQIRDNGDRVITTKSSSVYLLPANEMSPDYAKYLEEINYEESLTDDTIPS